VLNQRELEPLDQKRERRTRTASAKVTASEFAELESYAYQHGQSVSEWIRQTLLNEVRRCSNGSLDRHIFTELVGIQLLLINAIAPLIRGDRLTAEQLDAVLKRVQSIKSRKAQELLEKRANNAAAP
jgi:hypothetical protein